MLGGVLVYKSKFRLYTFAFRLEQFLQERVEIAKYSDSAQIQIVLSLLNKSLSVTVGRRPSIISRHTAAIGPRFRYTHY